MVVEGNNFKKDELYLKSEAYNTLNIAMKELRGDHDKDVEAA